MSNIRFIDIPALKAGMAAVNLDRDVFFFRKTLAVRLGFAGITAKNLREGVNELLARGFEPFGHTELQYLLEEEACRPALSRKLAVIRLAKPFQMPILVFPRDDLDKAEYPALTPTPQWSHASVAVSSPLCSERFLLPVKAPTT